MATTDVKTVRKDLAKTKAVIDEVVALAKELGVPVDASSSSSVAHAVAKIQKLRNKGRKLRGMVRATSVGRTIVDNVKPNGSSLKSLSKIAAPNSLLGQDRLGDGSQAESIIPELPQPPQPRMSQGAPLPAAGRVVPPATSTVVPPPVAPQAKHEPPASQGPSPVPMDQGASMFPPSPPTTPVPAAPVSPMPATPTKAQPTPQLAQTAPPPVPSTSAAFPSTTVPQALPESSPVPVSSAPATGTTSTATIAPAPAKPSPIKVPKSRAAQEQGQITNWLGELKKEAQPYIDQAFKWAVDNYPNASRSVQRLGSKIAPAIGEASAVSKIFKEMPKLSNEELPVYLVGVAKKNPLLAKKLDEGLRANGIDGLAGLKAVLDSKDEGILGSISGGFQNLFKAGWTDNLLGALKTGDWKTLVPYALLAAAGVFGASSLMGDDDDGGGGIGGILLPLLLVGAAAWMSSDSAKLMFAGGAEGIGQKMRSAIQGTDAYKQLGPKSLPAKVKQRRETASKEVKASDLTAGDVFKGTSQVLGYTPRTIFGVRVPGGPLTGALTTTALGTGLGWAGSKVYNWIRGGTDEQKKKRTRLWTILGAAGTGIPSLLWNLPWINQARKGTISTGSLFDMDPADMVAKQGSIFGTPVNDSIGLVLDDPGMNPVQKGFAISTLLGANDNQPRGFVSRGDLVRGAIGAGLGAVAGTMVGGAMDRLFGLPKPVKMFLSRAGLIGGALEGAGLTY